MQGRGRGSCGSHGRGLVEDDYPPAIADGHVDDVGIDSGEHSNMSESENESEEIQSLVSSDNEDLHSDDMSSSSSSSSSATSTPCDINVAQSTTTTSHANVGASSSTRVGGRGGPRESRGLPASSRWNFSTIWIANISIVERTDTGVH